VNTVFPNEFLVTLEEDPQIFQRQLFAYAVCKLYEQGRISVEQGAQILGCDPWEFYHILSENSYAGPDQSEHSII
jgi:predicted HTH domain antitoxin